MTSARPNPVGLAAARCNRGFTLIEVLFAIILIGLAIAGLTGSSLAYTRANGSAVDLTTAEFLIEQIHERTAGMTSVDAVFALDGQSYNPPISAGGGVLADAGGNALFPSFTQQVQVQNVSRTNFATVVADGSTSFYRVTVTILRNNSVISSQSWIRTRY
jgi:prepilin-type N-terminal cleavage/methylation domain-containing protein